jgi:hypothetical protein
VSDLVKLILFFSVLIFFGVALIICHLIERSRRTSQEIDGVRISIDALNEASNLEHGHMTEHLKLVAGRTQFLVADKIADGLGIERDKLKEPPKENTQ